MSPTSPVRAALRFGGVASLLIGGLFATLPHTTYLELPPALYLGAALLWTTVVSAGIGVALELQTQHPEEEGDRAGVDAVLAGLLSMGLLTVGGMVVAGPSDGLFFAASAGAFTLAALAWAYKRSAGHPVALLAFWVLFSGIWTGIAWLFF